jgi:glucose-1-phosphate thymidylyltransferase
MVWHKPFIIGEEFIGNDDVCLVLGDNIFYGSGFSGMLKNAKKIFTKEIYCVWILC